MNCLPVYASIEISEWNFGPRMLLDGRSSWPVSFQVNGKIYLIGGVSQYSTNVHRSYLIEIYDIETGKWSKALEGETIPLPSNMPDAVLVKNKIYLIGGWGNQSSNTYYDVAHIYDIDKGTLSVTSKIPAGVAASRSAYNPDDNKIYTVSGYATGSGSAICRLFIYDISKDKWSEGPRVQNDRHGHTVTYHAGKIYLFGGYVNSGGWRYYNCLDIYNIKESKWTTVRTTLARANHTATLVEDKIYFTGGETKYNTSTNAVSIFDTKTGKFSDGSPLHVARSEHNAINVDGKIIVTGGNFAQRQTPSEIYDISTDTWSTGAPFKHDRFRHAVAYCNDRLYAISGVPVGAHSTPSIEISSILTPNYSVTYNSNGGVGNDYVISNLKASEKHSTLAVTVPRFSRAGYTFIGWNTQPDGKGQFYHPHKDLTVNGNITLYALWRSKIKVFFDAAGGKPFEFTAIEATLGQPYGELPSTFREGYIFEGWYYED